MMLLLRQFSTRRREGATLLLQLLLLTLPLKLATLNLIPTLADYFIRHDALQFPE